MAPPSDNRGVQRAWARARLILGHSKGAVWEVTAEIPEARIAIGSSSQCAWVVSGSSVAALHFELFWDGSDLWVGNPQDAANLRVDGHPVKDWEALYDRSRIEFGSSVMSIESSSVRAGDVARGDSSEVMDLGGESTVIGESPTDLPASATIAKKISTAGDRAYETGASRLSELSVVPNKRAAAEVSTKAIEVDQDATRAPAIAPLAHSHVPDESSTKIVSNNPPRPPAREELANEATRLGDPLKPASTPPLSPRTGPGVVRAPSAAVGQAARPAPAQAPAAPTPNIIVSPNAGAATPPENIGMPPSQGAWPSPAQQPPAGTGQSDSPFAQPPPPDPDATSRALSNLTAKFAAIREQPKLSMPPRTWLLIALVVAIFLAFVLPELGPQEAEEEQSAQEQRRPDAGAPPAATPPVPVSAVGVVGQARSTQPNIPNPPTQRAADLLVAGRWQDALTHYEALALAEPTNPAYAKIAQVLRRRITEQCRDGVNSRGEPCEAPQ